MHSLTIAFGPTGAMWAFLFRTKEAADVAHTAVRTAQGCHGENITVEDEFGQTATFASHAVHGSVLEDLERTKMAHVERALHQARLQAKAQQMAQGDATLKAAQMMSGPAMLSPGGNGFRPMQG